MRTGIFTWLGYPIEMNACLKLIKDAGFDSVLLWWSDEEEDSEIIGKKKKHPELVYKNGLQIENAHLPFADINTIWEDKLDGDEYKRYLLQLIGECADFDIPTVVLHLTRGSTPPPIGTIGLDRFKELVDFAEKREISIAFENLRCVNYLDYIFENISSPRVGICYDSGHNNCFTPERNILNEYNHRIIATHLHDNDGKTDLHMLPFDGTINWNSLKSDLAISSLNCTLSLEVQKCSHEMYNQLTIEEFLIRAQRNLCRLLYP